MRERSLRAKIQLTFGLASLAFASALTFGIVQVRALRAELNRVDAYYLPLSRVTRSLEVLSATPLDFEGHFRLPSRDLAALRLRRRLFVGPLSQARELVGVVQISATSGLEAGDIEYVSETLDQVDALSEVYTGAMDNFVNAIETREREPAQARYRELEIARKNLADRVDDLTRATDRATRSAVSAAGTHAGTVLLALVTVTILTVFFGIVAVVIVARSLRPIGELAARAREVGAGDFGDGVVVRKGAGSEVATLASEFNSMIERLKQRDETLRALSVHLESIIEGIRSGLVVLNPEGEITRVNSAAEEIWGIARDVLIGSDVGVLPGAGMFADRIERVRSQAKSSRIAGVTVGERLVDVTLIPFSDGAIVVGDDVTDRVEMQRALLRSEKLAAIGRMSSQITHEVRNPLNSLSLNLELLEDELKGMADTDTEEAWRILKAISSEAERLNDVTEGYLGFARLPRPRMTRENLNDIVQGLLTFVKEEVRSRGVTLEVALASTLPDVLADENQIRQVLLNIIRNALEAMDEGLSNGKALLRVSTRLVDGGVEAVIEDSGPGMDIRAQSRIFDPFYSTKDQGTGVGLPLTQQIIEEHDGTLTCESEKGKGTTFIVRFPVA